MKAFRTIRFDFTQYNEYSFTHTVSNKTFKIYIRYNILFDKYFLDVDELVDGMYVPIVRNINLTTGVNLFAPYNHKGLGNLYLIPIKEDCYDKLPSSSNLVNSWFLIWQYYS